MSEFFNIWSGLLTFLSVVIAIVFFSINSFQQRKLFEKDRMHRLYSATIEKLINVQEKIQRMDFYLHNFDLGYSDSNRKNAIQIYVQYKLIINALFLLFLNSPEKKTSFLAALYTFYDSELNKLCIQDETTITAHEVKKAQNIRKYFKPNIRKNLVLCISIICNCFTMEINSDFDRKIYSENEYLDNKNKFYNSIKKCSEILHSPNQV